VGRRSLLLRPIKEIDYDAIVVLVSALVRFKAMQIRFAVDFPKEGECRRMLRQSGFVGIITRNQEFSDTDEYEINPKPKKPSSTLDRKFSDLNSRRS